MLRRGLMFFLPLLLAVLVILFMRGLIPVSFGVSEADDETAFKRDPAYEQVTAVYYDVIKADFITPEVTGYGRIGAAQTWQAVSQVNGRIIRLHDNLGVGSRLKVGDVALTIDDIDYITALDRAKATVISTMAQLEELFISQKNIENTLGIERAIEALDKEELERKTRLAKQGAASQAQLDLARRSLILQQKRVLDLENSLALIPSKIKALEASLTAAHLDVKAQKRALDNTSIALPFDARVSSLKVERDQYVRSGEVLAVFESLASPEVIADINPEAMGRFLQLANEMPNGGHMETAEAHLINWLKSGQVNVDVTQMFGGQVFVWAGEVVRLTGRIDNATGTIGLVVRIGELVASPTSSHAPPLINGALTKVRLYASTPAAEMSVPLSAVRYDDDKRPSVYTIDDDNRLVVTQVVTGAEVMGRLIIKSGLNVGDKVIVSSLNFAAAGMRLNPIARSAN